MNQIILSTLLLLVGLVIGFGLTMLINTLRKNNATKKIEEMLEEANKKHNQLKRINANCESVNGKRGYCLYQ